MATIERIEQELEEAKKEYNDVKKKLGRLDALRRGEQECFEDERTELEVERRELKETKVGWEKIIQEAQRALFATATPAVPPPDDWMKHRLDSIDEGIRTLHKANVEMCISSISDMNYRNFMNSIGMEEPKAVEVQISPTTKNFPREFVWGPEKEDKQIDSCLAWLSSAITIPKGKQICSVAGQKDLLNRVFGSYGVFGSYTVKGTTDLVFVPDKYVKNLNIRGGIEIAVELKKKIVPADWRQAIVELIAAGSSSHYPVVVLLTDLQHFWQFSWLSKFGIEQCVLEPSLAVSFIEATLEGSNSPVGRRYTMRQYLKERQGIKTSESPDITSEQALEELFSGKKIDPYDLVPKPEIGNMEDFFSEMTEDEISSYKFNHVAKCLSTSWQGMYV